MSIDFSIRVTHVFEEVGPFAELLGLLRDLKTQGASIMATEQQLLDVIGKINDATNQQAQALTADGVTLQKISDDIDRIVAGLTGTVADSTLAALQTAADNVAAVSGGIKTQADFSTSVAAKADAAVPLPVPGPTSVTPASPPSKKKS